MTQFLIWSGCARPPSGYHAVSLMCRLDAWSLPLSVKRGSHVIGRDGELGLTVGVLCFYLSWGFA